MLIRLRHLVFGLLALPLGAVFAKDASALPPPPMVQAESISLYRGQTVEIPLRAVGRAPGQLKFIIRSQPTKGTLGSIRIIDRKNAVVTYTHDDIESGTDRFMFAAQAPDSAVSAAAPISILISEQPPALTTTSSAEFGKVLLGESSEQEVTIRNTGGGQLAGQIEAPPPWSVVGSDKYSLARGEAARIRLRFSPTEEQTFTGRLTFSSVKRSWVLLSGQGSEAIGIEPRQSWELSGVPGSEERSLKVSFTNQTQEERTITVILPDQLKSVAPVTLEPNEEKSIVLEAKASLKGGLDATATVQEGQFSVKIPLKVFALPAILRFEPAGPINFGTVSLSRRAKRTLEIRNAGGSEARLSASAPKEILIVPNPNTVVLAEGQAKSFDLYFEAAQSNAWTGQLTVRANGGPPFNIPLAAQTPGQPGLIQLSLTREKQEGNVTEPSPALVTEPAPTLAGNPPIVAENSTPPITDVALKEATHEKIQLVWKKPASNVIGYVIEERVLDLSAGNLKVFWSVWKDVSLQTDDKGQVEATITGLWPGEILFIRISSLDELGKRSAPSPVIRIGTAPLKPWPAWLWFVPVLFLGAAGWLIWRRLQATTIDIDQVRLDQLGKS